MEPNIEDLKVERLEILEDVLKIIEDWDKSYEMGIEIIEGVGLGLEEIKSINDHFDSFVPFDEAYEEKLTRLRDDYGNFLESLQGEKEKLLELIKETGLKKRVKESYILNDKGSVFIDKDL